MLLTIMAAMAVTQVQGPNGPMTDLPRSIGPNKNIYEVRAQSPAHTFEAAVTPELEQCLTIALSFGLGGAPIITRQSSEALIVSLLPKTFGLVSSMLVIKPSGVIEYRGRQEFELRLVRQCLGLPARQSGAG